MPLTESQKKSQLRYNKRSKTQFSICFHNVNDADVIEKLKSIEGSRQDYIRQLIRQDIERSKK